MARKDETQKSIASWAEETFGPVAHHSVLVDRAIAEMAELSDAVRKNNPDDIGKEAADVAILLHRILELNGLDLHTEIELKMIENRTRKWNVKGDGTGNHIK